ncbi:tautomerase family protein [Dyella sp.]|uniref:tautomerase family protein n=1 Tax=Dyella sp. TaxID=1869338 RepID=UPI002ED6C001
MPYARITLHKGKSESYLRALADGLFQAMHESFETPATDRFQVIHQVEPGELIYDRDYLGGPRSQDFVHIAITVGRPRDAQTKQRFYQHAVTLLAQNTGIDPEDVMIVVHTTASEDWSFGGGRQGITAAQVLS